MDKKWKELVLTIAVCLIMVLTLIDVGLFTAVKFQTGRVNQLASQKRQQEISIESFIMQLQQCKTMDDVDDVLKIVNVERIK